MSQKPMVVNELKCQIHLQPWVFKTLSLYVCKTINFVIQGGLIMGQKYYDNKFVEMCQVQMIK
jgi:hypothetical protein